MLSVISTALPVHEGEQESAMTSATASQAEGHQALLVCMSPVTTARVQKLSGHACMCVPAVM